MLFIVAPVLQPHRTGFEKLIVYLYGESELNKEVQLCTQLSKQVVSKLKLKKAK